MVEWRCDENNLEANDFEVAAIQSLVYYCLQEDGVYQLCCYDVRAGEEVRLSCPEEPEPRRAAFYPGDGSLLPVEKSDSRDNAERSIVQQIRRAPRGCGAV